MGRLQRLAFACLAVVANRCQAAEQTMEKEAVWESLRTEVLGHVQSLEGGDNTADIGSAYDNDAKMMVALGPLAEEASLLAKLGVEYNKAKTMLELHGKSEIVSFWEKFQPEQRLKGLKAFQDGGDDVGPQAVHYTVVDDNEVILVSTFASEMWSGKFNSAIWKRSSKGMAWKLFVEDWSIIAASTGDATEEPPTGAAGTTQAAETSAPSSSTATPTIMAAPASTTQGQTALVSKEKKAGSGSTLLVVVLVFVGCLAVGILVRHAKQRQQRASYENIKGFETMLG